MYVGRVDGSGRRYNGVLVLLLSLLLLLLLSLVVVAVTDVNVV